MGLSVYWIQQTGNTCGQTYYTHTATAQGRVPIATSHGYEIDDSVCDLDGDGTTELICNVTYGLTPQRASMSTACMTVLWSEAISKRRSFPPQVTF